MAAGFFLLAVGYHLAMAWRGVGAFRDIHLGAALHYAQSEISLEQTRIIGFNATGTPTAQELPLWQAAAGGVMKLLGPWWGWGNVVSLLGFASGLWPLWQMARRHLEPRAAAWSLVFYLASPLGFFYAGVASVDGWALALMLWFWDAADRLIARPTVARWGAAACFGVLAAVMKVPFFMAAALASVLTLWQSNRGSGRRWGALAGVGLVAVAAFAVWTGVTNAMLERATLPMLDLRISDPGMWYWYFGDWAYRLSPATWARAGWRGGVAVFGSLFLAGLALYGWVRRVPVARNLAWGVLGVTLVFAHLVLHHNHYFLMLLPATALLLGAGMAGLEAQVAALRRPLATLAVGGLLGASLVQGLLGMEVQVYHDRYFHRVAEVVRAHSGPGDRLLVQGGGWGGEVLSRAGREGLSIWNTRLLENPETLRKLRELGYTRLVMISESPLIDALQRANPGQAARERDGYWHHITPVVEPWPALHQTEDVLIKALP